MKILKYLIFSLLAIFALAFTSAVTGLTIFDVSPEDLSKVFFDYGGVVVAVGPVIPFIDNNGNALYSETGGPLGSQARTGEVEQISKIAEVAIKMGAPVQYGTTGSQVKPMATGATRFLGIALYNPMAQGFTNGIQYNANEGIIVATEGTFWVNVEEAVDEKSPVRVRLVNHASDPLKLAGNFATTADEDKTALLKGAYFESAQAGATGGPVMLRITDSTELVLDNLT